MALSDYQVMETVTVSGRHVLRRALRRRDGANVLIKHPALPLPTVHDLRQLEFEYRLLRKLDLAATVKPLALEKSVDEVALVLEDFGGCSPVPGAGGMELGAFFGLALAACRALGELHEKGVIHKNVQPRSLLWNADTQALKLVDLHAASELASERGAAGSASQLAGSLPYLSPEQTGRMNRDLDYRTDYYSLGVTLFELLTGQRPFSADDAMGFIHCHLSKRAPLAMRVRSDAPHMVSEIIRTLMAKDPEERYQSARGLCADLERCREQWARSGEIDGFTLRAQDVSECFQVPQRLFGREAQVAALLDVFREASEGEARLLLVSGYSGVGKSSLIHEVERPIVRKNGYFAAGKFDQLERNIPYAAVVQAFGALARQLLADTDERLEHWRQELTRALGESGQVMVELVPELERIIGQQAALPELSNAADAQHRFRRAFREFIKVFARPSHPLVVFLDDLQWMDASMPELIADLFAHGDVRHLLLVGAYRDNEVAEGHLLLACLRDLRERKPEAVRQVALAPLDETAVNQLVAETLRAGEQETRALTRLIFDKTEGNPLFTSELLHSLQRDGAFTFRAAQGRWEWSLEKVQKAAVSDSVGALMVQRVSRLSPEASRVLKIAACLGSHFDVHGLARVSGQTAAQIAEALWEPTLQRLVLPLDENYRLMHDDDAQAGAAQLRASYQFQHDRVQQVLYALLDERERAALHLSIGRLLLSELGSAERGERLLPLVNHLNLGRALIEQPAERARLSRLNAQAALQARGSAAYAIAADYLAHALNLSPAESGDEHAAMRFELLGQRAECLLLCGEVERAAELCEQLFERAHSRVELGSAFYLKTRIVEHQGKLFEAVATVRAGLRVFDVELPEDHAEIDRRIGVGIGQMRAHLERVAIEDLVKLPELRDPERVMVLNLLFQVIPPAIQTHPPLFILAELMMFDLALTFGTAEVSCKNFVDCGIIQGAVLGNYEVAYRLGQSAFELLERYRPTTLGSAVHFVFANFISHWRAHFREGTQANINAQRLGMESGDVQHAAYASVHRCQRMLLVGRSLEECEADNRETVAYLKGARAAGQLLGMDVTLRAVAQLTGSDGDAAVRARADEAAFATLIETKNAQWSFSFGVAQMMVSLVLGEPEAAERWLSFTEPFAPAGNGLLAQADYCLFEALIGVRRLAHDAGRRTALSLIERNAQQLERWAQNCPENFLHKARLLEAELARARGEPLARVAKLYEEAIEATGGAFIQFSALAHELAAEYWLLEGHPKIANMMLRGAYQLYARWGAREKLRRLERAHASLRIEADAASVGGTDAQQRPLAAAPSTLDLSSVLKATQAISSEVKPERLFARLMDTIIENAGAQRGSLILRSEPDQRLYVAASANVEEGAPEAWQSTWLEAAADVCPDLVRYVARTRETVVLDDASREGAFEGDPYVQAHAVHSLLCMPVVSQGNLVAILYAENNEATRVFTKQRLGILQVIASQAAISISNALLYNNLEQSVAARTEELAQKNRETAAMLNGIEQGIFTIDERLLIQPQYSRQLARILGTEDIAGRSCIELLCRHAELAADTLSAMEAALRFSFGTPAVLAEANMQHLVREFAARRDGQLQHFEVDWSLILDAQERVGKVLVVVRDVSVLKQLNEAAARRSLETDIVAQILDAGVDAFLEFCETSRRLLEESRALLAAEQEPSRELLETLFRGAHTVKGNARLLGFSHLVSVVHEVEELYAQARQRERSAGDAQRLSRGVERMSASLEEYEQVFRRKLSPLAQGRDARFERATREIQRLARHPELSGGSEAALERIGEWLSRLRAVPFSELVRSTSRMLPSLAQELGSTEPALEYLDGASLLLREEWGAALRDVLVHGFRNSIAHGIESSAERRAAGKDPRGTLRVRAERGSDGARIYLSDDGRGLPLEALEQHAGASRRDEELAELAFASGISTSHAVSQLAGRGVGLDLMRAVLRRLGGDLELRFVGERRASHRPFELVASIPSSALLRAAEAPGAGSAPSDQAKVGSLAF